MQPAIRKFGLIFFASLLFHLAGTWTLPLIDRDEPRFAEASREMLERNDFVVPYFNNGYRFDKPPLTYWLQTASYRLLGENDFAARLPSAIAATLTALLVFAWGRRIGPERMAWWAAIIFTVCFQTFVHAKAAVADMWLVLFMTAAHWAGYELLRDRLGLSASNARPSPRWWWIFYCALALAFLAKGPIGFLPLLTVAVSKRFLPDAKLNRRFLFLTGIAFTLSVIALWGIPALVRTDGEFVRIGIGRHVVNRSIGTFHGHGGGSILTYLGTLPFYFLTIFLSFFPWAFSLPWLTKKLWRKRDLLDLYLVGGVAVIFIVFTLVKTKLPHYTLPAFPLLALLLAKALLDFPEAQRFVRRTAVTAASIGLLAAAATPFAAKYFVSAELERLAGSEVTAETEFGSTAYRDPSLVWYFRKHSKRWRADLQETDVHPFMELSGRRLVVLPTALVGSLYPVTPPGWKKYAARGLNMTNGQPLDLTLLLKPF